MKVTYTKKGDYLLPDLTIKKQDYKQINKYGYLRLDYKKISKKRKNLILFLYFTKYGSKNFV